MGIRIDPPSAGVPTQAQLQAVLDTVYAAIGDPLGFGVAYNFLPQQQAATDSTGANNRCLHSRAFGGAAITKIALQVTTASGNIDVGITRGAGGNGAPAARAGSSGSVVTPAAGVVEIALTAGVTVSPRTDYFAIALNNTVAQAKVVAASVSNPATGWGTGLSYAQDTSFPIPANPAPTAGAHLGHVMVGRP